MCLLCRLVRRPGPPKGWLAEPFTLPSTSSAYNPGAMTIYDRTLARFSRRELMKLAWMLGAAAVAPPILTRRVFAKPVFEAFPFAMGVASGDPLPDGVVLWTRLAPKPLEGGGMPMASVEVRSHQGESGRSVLDGQ